MTSKEALKKLKDNADAFVYASLPPNSINQGDKALDSNSVAEQTLQQIITAPTLDDAIKVVEEMFEKENERLRKITQAFYSKSWLVTLSKNILAYNINFEMEVITALKGLKEGKE